MFRNLHLRVGFHNLLRVFFLSFKLFSFLAIAFLSTADVETTQDFLAAVVASSDDDVDSSVPVFGLAWISVKILALVQ